MLVVVTGLGCGAEWYWEVRTRTGELVARPSSRAWNLSAEEGGRRLDDVGEVSLTVRVDCCDEIAAVESGDELFLYREGVLSWFGPIVKPVVQEPFGDAVLEASDRGWWFDGRYFAFEVDWTNRDAGLNVRDLLAANTAIDALVAVQWDDPPPGYLLGVQLSMVPAVSASFRSALDTLGNSVIDWTIIGDKMLVGVQGTPTGSLPMLDGSSWTDGRFTRATDHNDYATQVIVAGKDALQGYWPPQVTTPPFRPPPHPRWGARDVRIADSTLSDIAACITRARVEYEQRNPPPRRVSVPDGDLVDARIDFGQLIPGASCVVAAPDDCGGTTLLNMLLATVSWQVVGAREVSVTAAFVEAGSVATP